VSLELVSHDICTRQVSLELVSHDISARQLNLVVCSMSGLACRLAMQITVCILVYIHGALQLKPKWEEGNHLQVAQAVRDRDLRKAAHALTQRSEVVISPSKPIRSFDR